MMGIYALHYLPNKNSSSSSFSLLLVVGSVVYKIKYFRFLL